MITTVHGVGPHADALVIVVRESGRALVTRGLSVPARVENAAVVVIGEDAVQTRAVGGGNRRLWRIQEHLECRSHRNHSGRAELLLRCGGANEFNEKHQFFVSSSEVIPTFHGNKSDPTRSASVEVCGLLPACCKRLIDRWVRRSISRTSCHSPRSVLSPHFTENG